MRRPRFIAEHAEMRGGCWSGNCLHHGSRNLEPESAGDGLRSALIERSNLDLGCGHGRSLTETGRPAATGRVVGVDSSELMVEIRSATQPSAHRAARVDVVLATVNRCPFPMTSSTRCCAFTCSISGKISTCRCVRSPPC